MGLAQDGAVDDALALAGRALEDAPGATPSDQAGLWYAISVARHIQGDNDRALHACEQCLGLAVESDNPGWASNALSMRGMAAARQGRMEPALLDLARAESELERCADDGLRCWAHTGLGYAYLELRLYELSLPHMVAAQEINASPFPLVQAPVIDLMNLAELHLRWADELERVFPDDLAEEDVAAHRKEGHVYAERALAVALEKGNPRFVATCRAMELCARPRGRRRLARGAARGVRHRGPPRVRRAAVRSSAARWPGRCGCSAGATRPSRGGPPRGDGLRRGQRLAGHRERPVAARRDGGPVPACRAPSTAGPTHACCPGCCGSSG